MNENVDHDLNLNMFIERTKTFSSPRPDVDLRYDFGTVGRFRMLMNQY